MRRTLAAQGFGPASQNACADFNSRVQPTGFSAGFGSASVGNSAKALTLKPEATAGAGRANLAAHRCSHFR
jgi:hypothetical protein